jgi:hypothetical protein
MTQPHEQFEERFEELLHRNPRGYEAIFRWMVESGNLIALVTGRKGVHWEQTEALLQEIPTKSITDTREYRMLGLLSATRDDLKRGLLKEIRYAIYAETFDDFLDVAATYHKGGRKIESAVLASAVLEDTMKRVAQKNNIDDSGSLDPLIDRLKAADVFTPVQAKRMKVYAGVRKHAFHAEWEELDLRDIGEMISWLRELVATHLD